MIRLFDSEIVCRADSLTILNGLLNSRFGKCKKVVIADSNTYKHCFKQLVEACTALRKAKVIIIPAGEHKKSMDTAMSVWSALLKDGADRSTIIINLGGGVVSDLSGFAAAVYMRGIKYINVPTTLLAMVDAAIGGKTGVDFGLQKNLLGSFTMPVATYIYLPFLNTLRKTELKNGVAEIIKSALIANVNLLKHIENSDLTRLISYSMIKKVAGIKAGMVKKDFNDAGERMKLNLGHTVAHAIEAYMLWKKQPVSHGNAVASGLLYESVLAVNKNLMKRDDLNRIEKLLAQYFVFIQFNTRQQQKLISYMKLDKKNSSGEIKFTLLQKPGVALINQTACSEEIIMALNYFNNKINT